MRLTELISQFEDHLDAADQATFWGAERITRYIDSSLSHLVRRTHQLDETQLMLTDTIAIVSGTELYNAPRGMRRGGRILFLADNATKVPYSRLNNARDFLYYGGPGLTALAYTMAFTLQGDQVRVAPPPTQNAMVLIGFTPAFGNLLEGPVTSGTATTFTVWANPNWTTTYGKPSRIDDQYIGMDVLVFEGTNAGEIRRITDYVGSTRTFTVGTAFSSVMDTTSKIALIPPMDEEFHSLIATRASWKGSARNRNRQKELQAILREELDEYISWTRDRILTQGRVVVPMDMDSH